MRMHVSKKTLLGYIIMTQGKNIGRERSNLDEMPGRHLRLCQQPPYLKMNACDAACWQKSPIIKFTVKPRIKIRKFFKEIKQLITVKYALALIISFF